MHDRAVMRDGVAVMVVGQFAFARERGRQDLLRLGGGSRASLRPPTSEGRSIRPRRHLGSSQRRTQSLLRLLCGRLLQDAASDRVRVERRGRDAEPERLAPMPGRQQAHKVPSVRGAGARESFFGPGAPVSQLAPRSTEQRHRQLVPAPPGRKKRPGYPPPGRVRSPAEAAVRGRPPVSARAPRGSPAEEPPAPEAPPPWPAERPAQTGSRARP